MNDKGYVYLFGADRYYKIGKSTNVESRVRGLSQMPFPIDIIHVIAVDHMSSAEKLMHRYFADKRVNGEWFSLSSEDVELICSFTSEDAIFLALDMSNVRPCGARLRVKELAEQRGLNMSQLQRESRLTMNMVRRYWYNTADGKEQGKQLKEVSLEALDSLASVFNVQPGDLIARND